MFPCHKQPEDADHRYYWQTDVKTVTIAYRPSVDFSELADK